MEHGAVRRELRVVTWAVPALLGRVPANLASEMRARSRQQMQLAGKIPAGRNLAAVALNDSSLARPEVIGRPQAVGHRFSRKVLQRRQVLADVVENAGRCLAGGIVDRFPG